MARRHRQELTADWSTMAGGDCMRCRTVRTCRERSNAMQKRCSGGSAGARDASRWRFHSSRGRQTVCPVTLGSNQVDCCSHCFTTNHCTLFNQPPRNEGPPRPGQQPPHGKQHLAASDRPGQEAGRVKGEADRVTDFGPASLGSQIVRTEQILQPTQPGKAGRRTSLCRLGGDPGHAGRRCKQARVGR